MGTVGKTWMWPTCKPTLGCKWSKGKATASLWAADTGRAIFPATMSLNTFHVYSRVIRFDDRETRQGQQERDKLDGMYGTSGFSDYPFFTIQAPFTDRATVVSYCPKKGKIVLLMSTMHKDAALSTREDRKPQMVLDYKTKGGVDNLDEVIATYSCRRMTARWPLVIIKYSKCYR